MRPINLLPWREWQQQAYKRGSHLLIGGGVAIAAAIVAGLGFLNDKQIEEQQRRNDFLQAQIKVLDSKLNRLGEIKDDHAKLEAKINLVTRLQAKRVKVPKFMSEVPAWIAPNVYVDKIDMNDDEVTLTGFGKDTASIAAMINNLENTPLAHDVNMHYIVNDKELFNQSYNSYAVSFVFDSKATRSRQ